MVASGTLCLIFLFLAGILISNSWYTAKIGCHRKVKNLCVFLKSKSTPCHRTDLSVIWVLEMHTIMVLVIHFFKCTPWFHILPWYLIPTIHILYKICSCIILISDYTAIDRIHHQFTQGEVQMAAKLKSRYAAIPLRQGEHLAALLWSIWDLWRLGS